MTFRVGLTGGIGSGKTTVANLFSTLGVPIIDADVISHDITKPHAAAYQHIVDHFGQSILNQDGTIHRRKLRALIFNDPIEKAWLENLLHPLIRSTMRDQVATVSFPYCICVIPLLIESNGNYSLDRILVVDAPITLQLLRAKERDASTPEEVEKIIAAQADQAARLAIANDVLINDADLSALEKQVYALHQRYLKLAGH